MKNLSNNWENVLELLANELSPTAFDAWFLPLVAKSVDNDKKILYIEAENSFILDSIKDRYYSIFKSAISAVFGSDYSISLNLHEKEDVTENENENVDSDFSQEYYLNPRFTFSKFVNAPCNDFAYRAALAIAEAPGKSYNPLFLYGDSGLGKTHLMHAIGQYVLTHYPEKKVLYISSEMFTNELINSIQHNRMADFRRKYRNVDVLLIDDIQFIEGRDRTQEEFFNTFTTLADRNKQIVISSDRSPQQLTQLDKRLTSRFNYGLSADLKAPDLETRIAILNSKADSIPDLVMTPELEKIIELIAHKIKDNIRELEGALTKIIAHSTLLNKPLDEITARKLLKDHFNEKESIISIPYIKKIVADYYNINVKEIDSKKRDRNIAIPRQISMYLSKELTNESTPAIGKEFFKDHSTVIHACTKISDMIDEDDDFKAEIEILKVKIKEG